MTETISKFLECLNELKNFINVNMIEICTMNNKSEYFCMIDGFKECKL